jgi:hypothetical protein
MKGQLRLERIGEISASMKKLMGGGPRSPWVAELKGESDRYRLNRKFLPYNKNFEKANRAGSRGVFAEYILESGKAYEVFERTSWSSSRNYFVTVTNDGEIREITKHEAITIAIHQLIDEKFSTI